MDLLDRCLTVKEERRLCVMVRELFGLAAQLVVVHRFGKRRKAQLPAGTDIHRRASSARRRRDHGDGLPLYAIALIVVDLSDRGVDRQFAESSGRRADLAACRGTKSSALQQGIVAEVNAGHDMLRAERHLLGFGKEVVRVAIQHHPAHRAQRYQFLRHDLGGVEHVEAELFGLLLGEDL